MNQQDFFIFMLLSFLLIEIPKQQLILQTLVAVDLTFEFYLLLLILFELALKTPCTVLQYLSNKT